MGILKDIAKPKHGKIVQGRKLLKEFESTIAWAELRALSKLSLERPLTDSQYRRMMVLKKQLME